MNVLKSISLFLIFILSAQYSLAISPLKCEQVFSHTVFHNKNHQTEIKDLFSFGQAMTEGMILHEDQEDLFEIYRKTFFGDPKTVIDNKTLKSVTEILEKNPQLQKTVFREYEISSVSKLYTVPESLAKYLSSQTQSAGNVRNNLFQIEANIGFWKRLLDFPETPAPDSLNKLEQREWSLNSKKKFEKYLNRIISKANRQLLNELSDDNNDSQKKVLTLFKTLYYIETWMEKKGRNTQPLRQALVDLVHTAGFGNPSTQILLKSKNGLDKIEGLKKILDQRDTVAMELGYIGHFQELQKSLRIDYPTGLSKNENPAINIQKLEKEVLSSKYITLPMETFRVRSLSIQEAPFRSCLGGSDCASRTYFSKALDPNFNYFTMTDRYSQSSGHVTVVLGEALNPLTHKHERVAFVDKVQNISNSQLTIFLQAVSLSLKEHGYKLALPEDVGDHNGISNLESTRIYLKNDVLPLLSSSLTQFIPHSHQYQFQNKYSRAYNQLSVKIYEPVLIDKDDEIKAGRHYSTHLAKKDLNKNQLVADFLKLKRSQDPQEVLKYISSGNFIYSLEKMNLYTFKEFESDLEEILQRKDLDFQVKKQALYETFFIDPKNKQLGDADENLLHKLDSFNQVEKYQIGSEIKQWIHSTDKRKQVFASQLRKTWSKAIIYGDLNRIKTFIDLNIFNVNYKNENGFSGILMAAEADQKQIVDWFLDHPLFKPHETDEFGNNLVEQVQLLGKNEIALHIADKLRLKEFKTFNVIEKTPKGKPLVDFVKIRPGSYFIGEQKNIQVNITKPFEMMSTQISLQLWRDVTVLAEKELSYDFQVNKDPYENRFDDFWFSSHYELIVSQHNNNQKGLLSHFFNKFLNVGNKNTPDQLRTNADDYSVDWISHNDVTEWLKALNTLSDSPNIYVQNELKKILPHHKMGDHYDLPTSAQWEFVARQRGLISESLFRNYTAPPYLSTQDPQRYSSTIYMIGSFKPFFINGKPIYDMNSEVWEYMKDHHHSANPTGGNDPGLVNVVSLSSDFVIRRGSEIHFRIFNNRENNVGFRLVRN